MSKSIQLPAARASLPVGDRRRLHERGLTTVEYALGVVVVIVVIGVVIVAIQTGSFQTLVDELLQALMGWLTSAFNLPIPWLNS